VLVAGDGVAVHRHGDVVHAQDEVVGLHDALGPLHPVGILEQGDDMERTGFFDGVVKAGK
jgi:hypothetical protein